MAKTRGELLRFLLLEPHEVAEKLISMGYFDENKNLTKKGKDWVEDRLKGMDNGELALIEKYFAEHFGEDIEYIQ